MSPGPRAGAGGGDPSATRALDVGLALQMALQAACSAHDGLQQASMLRLGAQDFARFPAAVAAGISQSLILELIPDRKLRLLKISVPFHSIPSFVLDTVRKGKTLTIPLRLKQKEK